MKKRILLSVAMVMMAIVGYSQSYIVVNTETIFKAVPAFTKAQTELDNYAKECQTKIDNAYAEIETLYNRYQEQKSALSPTVRAQSEANIINKEKNVQEYQEKVFGQEGDLMKKRVEVLKPIQDRVFEIIDNYAKSQNVDLVLDIATNPIVLYNSSRVDKSQEIINLINK